MLNLFHYTDQEGWNAIRAQEAWVFKASKPKDPERPLGVYFTDIEPSPITLRTLHKRLRIPKVKQEFVFWFVDAEGLTQLFDGRGRDKHIYFSSKDYRVERDRQKYSGNTQTLLEKQK